MTYRSSQRRRVATAWQWDRTTMLLVAAALVLALFVILEVHFASAAADGHSTLQTERR